MNIIYRFKIEQSLYGFTTQSQLLIDVMRLDELLMEFRCVKCLGILMTTF